MEGNEFKAAKEGNLSYFQNLSESDLTSVLTSRDTNNRVCLIIHSSDGLTTELFSEMSSSLLCI